MESKTSADYSAVDYDTGNVPIEIVHPLTESPTEFTIILSAVLLISLVVGVCGNASLVCLIAYIRKWSAPFSMVDVRTSRQQQGKTRKPLPFTPHRTTSVPKVSDFCYKYYNIFIIWH